VHLVGITILIYYGARSTKHQVKIPHYIRQSGSDSYRVRTEHKPSPFLLSSSSAQMLRPGEYSATYVNIYMSHLSSIYISISLNIV
jgi:hypothetical protein